jgi:hypothetical protein
MGEQRERRVMHSIIQEQVKEVLRKVSEDIREDFGEMKGEFTGLKTYMESKTDECKNNYVSITEHMKKLTDKIQKVRVREVVEGEIKKEKRNKFMVACTMICTFIGISTFAGFEVHSINKSEKKIVQMSKELDKLKIEVKETGK